MFFDRVSLSSLQNKPTYIGIDRRQLKTDKDGQCTDIYPQRQYLRDTFSIGHLQTGSLPTLGNSLNGDHIIGPTP